MIDPELRYGFITSQLTYSNEKIVEAFNRFIQLFAAIVGGSIWLRIQPTAKGIRLGDYAPISDVLVLVVTSVSAAIVVNETLAWWGYRVAECSLVGRQLAQPHWWKSCWAEYLMLLSMAAACGAFWTFNPFAH